MMMLVEQTNSHWMPSLVRTMNSVSGIICQPWDCWEKQTKLLLVLFVRKVEANQFERFRLPTTFLAQCPNRRSESLVWTMCQLWVAVEQHVSVALATRHAVDRR